MPTRKRSNYHPVCYVVSGNGHNVAVSNQFVAKIIYQLWIQLSVSKNIATTVTIDAYMSPNSWSTWSRRHIIALLNGSWTKRLICKATVANGEYKEHMYNTQIKITGDEYESFAKHTYSQLSKPVAHALNNALMYPNILQLILRAPTALSARVALKVEGYLKWQDGTKIDHIDKVWEYLHFEVRRT